jgi:hypothetical protein
MQWYGGWFPHPQGSQSLQVQNRGSGLSFQPFMALAEECEIHRTLCGITTPVMPYERYVES